VDDRCVGAERNPESVQDCPGANVGVLAIHEELLVEAVEAAECVGAKDEKHASKPGGALKVAASSCEPSQENVHGRKQASSAVLAPTAAVDDRRRRDPVAGFQCVEQYRKRIFSEPDVRVAHREERLQAPTECRVVVAPETERGTITYYFHWKRRSKWQLEGFWRIAGDDHPPQRGRSNPRKIREQLANQRALVVRHDRQADATLDGG
jgi:hypothetical protein